MKRACGWIGDHPWLALAAAAAAALAAAVVVIGSGVIPIKASSGHWPITAWVLNTAMSRSVATHSLMTVDAAPGDLDSQASVLRGAGHYETGCRSCHGAPGEPLPVIARAMTPRPPALQPIVAGYDAGELFYIVKHGVKFTGMPAWPSQQRDDEVWAMVGFLRRLPRMSSAEYGRLVSGGQSAPPPDALDGGAAAPPIAVEACARCHGVDGRARGAGAFPRLAGQRLDYLTRAMAAFADGRRHSGIMEPLARRYVGEGLQEALRHYASMPLSAGVTGLPATVVARGAALAHDGDASREIPSCASCHEAEPVNDAYPRLRGQDAAYLSRQLRLLQQRRRGGSEFVPLMHNFVDRLTDQDIEDVTTYFAAAAPAR
jgi:cytochrome c553